MSPPPATTDPVAAPLLQVSGLTKQYAVRKGIFSRVSGYVRAVDGVTFDLFPGEVLGLVGESGCGKTTTGRCILRLVEPTTGSVRFEGRELVGMPRRELRGLRRHMQMIFQDPYSSLNPRLSIESTLLEAVTVHRRVPRREAKERVAELLTLVGLSPGHVHRYPHEFSGGQRQRIGIARALAVNPKLVVADEPVSALDVSIQAQIVNLLRELQQRLQLALLFVAHDLAVVEHMSDRVAVMYLGRIVELATSDALYRAPRHPYTAMLLSAIPVPDPSRRRTRVAPRGDVPDPKAALPACGFCPRCALAQEVCRTDSPPLREVSPGHWAACHFAETVAEH